ncbi:hypothetical protein BOX15_Mlig017626g1, partial [Macrostomum lignano]
LMKQKQQLPSSSSDLDCAECGFIIPKSVGNYHRCSVCLLSAHLDCSARLFPASLIAKVGAASSSSSSVCRFCSQNSACQKCDDSGSNNSDNSETCSCLVCERPVLSSAEQFTQCPSCLLGVHRHCIVNTDARAASYRQLFQDSTMPPFCKLCASHVTTKTSTTNQKSNAARSSSSGWKFPKGFGNAEATSGGSSKLNSDGSSATFGSATLKPTLKRSSTRAATSTAGAGADSGYQESEDEEPREKLSKLKTSLKKKKAKLLAKSKPARGHLLPNLVSSSKLVIVIDSDDNLSDSPVTCVACEGQLSPSEKSVVQCPTCQLACHDDPECSADVFPSPPRCRLCQSGATVSTPAGADDRLFNADGSEECPMCLNSLPSQVATPDCCPHHRFCPPCLRSWAAGTRICPLDRRPFRMLQVRALTQPDTVLSSELATGSSKADARMY